MTHRGFYASCIRTVYAPNAKHFLNIFLLTGLSELTILSIPYLSGLAIASRHESFSTVLWICGAMIGVFLFRMAAITFVQDRIRITKLDYVLPRQLAEYVLRLLGHRHHGLTPEVAARREEEGVRALYSLTDTLLFKAMPEAIRCVFLLVALLWTSPILAGISTLSVLVYGFIAWLRYVFIFHLECDAEAGAVDAKAKRADVHGSPSGEERENTLVAWLRFQTEIDSRRIGVALRGRAWDRFRTLPLRFGEVGVLLVGVLLEADGVIGEAILISCVLWAREQAKTCTSIGNLLARLSIEWARVRNLSEMLSIP